MPLSCPARWLAPALLFSALPLFSHAAILHGVGPAMHILPAVGQAATPADAAPPAQPPQTPEKPIANRKHLNLSVGPVKMHLPVSGKRPVTPAPSANGNTGEALPVLVHPVQQPLARPADGEQVMTTPAGSDPTPPGAAMKVNTPIITKDAIGKGRINPTDVEDSRSASAPGIGTGNPQHGQERDIINKGLPITNKNIVGTEPKVTGPGAGAKPGAPAIYDHGGYTHVEQGGTMTGIQERPTPPHPGQQRDIINKGLPITNKNIEPTNRSVTGTLNTWPQKQAAASTQPGGSVQVPATAANQRNAPAPVNQNGKAGPHETIGVPIQGTEVGLEHNPGGMATQGATNGSNGKAGPHETVTPISGTPVILQHEPEGMATHGTTNAGNAKAGSQPQTRGTPAVSSSAYRTVTTDKLQGPQGALAQPKPKPHTAAPKPQPRHQ